MHSGTQRNFFEGSSFRQSAVFMFLTMLAVCLSAGPRASAADIYWSNSLGGDFSTGANWTGGVVPGTADNADFNLNAGSYRTTSFSQNVTNTAMKVYTDRVWLDLGGYTYTLSGDLNVGYSSGNVGHLTFYHGTQSVAGNSMIGYQNVGCTGHVVADGSSGLTWNTTLDMYVGGYSTGTLDVLSGAALTLRKLFVGYAGSTGTGTLTVDQSGSTLTTSGDTYISYNRPGTLTISNGATVNSNGAYAYAGVNAGSQATVIVGGANSTWNIAGSFFCGSSGNATVSVSNGGAIISNGGRMADYSTTSVDQLTVSGSGSRWVINNVIYYSRAGQSTLTVSSGGLLDTHSANSTMYMGDVNAAANGTITVDGPGSWWNGYSVYLGGTSGSAVGRGNVNVNASGLLSMANIFKLWSTGTLSLSSGTVEMPAGKKIENLGTLAGSGTIRRSGASGTMTVENKNLCSPGGDGGAGILAIQNGLYTQSSAGKTTVELNNVLDFDQVIAADAAVTFDGNLTVKTLPGHVLHAGEIYDVVIGSTVTLGGSFSLTDIPSPVPWSASYSIATISSGTYAGKQALRLTISRKPPTVEDLGAVYSSAGISHADMWKDKYNEMHLVVFYRRATDANCAQFVHINMTTGSSWLLTAPVAGRLWKPAYDAATHALYVGGVDPGNYFKYDLTSHACTTVRSPLADKDPQTQCNADDGTIYIGEAVYGYLERYNPVTGTWYNYGIMDDPGPPYYRYIYRLGADSRYAFCTIKQDTLWYLVVYDTQTAAQTVYWKTLGCTDIQPTRGSDGLWYVQRNISGVITNWRMDNGVPVSVPSIPGGVTPWYMQGAVCMDQASFPTAYNHEVNLDLAIPDNSNSSTGTIKYRVVGAPSWTTVSKGGMTIDPQPTERVTLKPDGNLFGVISAYQPAFTYTISTLTPTILGQLSQASMHDVLVYDNRYYLSGYDHVFAEYDSTQPWTLAPSTSNWTLTSINPHNITGVGGAGALYNRYMAKGPGNRIYIGEHWERSGVGGEVGWYNPANGAKGSLRTPFLVHDANDLIAVNSGTQLCYSTMTTDGSNAKLFLLQFNEGTQALEVVNSWVPLTGSTQAGKVVEVAPGVVFGVKVNSNKAYRFNLNSGVCEYTVTLPGTNAFGQKVSTEDARLILGPDGYVWLFIEDTGSLSTKLYRYNPTTGTGEVMVDNIGNQRGRPFIFAGDDVYMYGLQKTSLERIQDVLP